MKRNDLILILFSSFLMSCSLGNDKNRTYKENIDITEDEEVMMVLELHGDTIWVIEGESPD